LTRKAKKSDERSQLECLYKKVRSIRENNKHDESLKNIFLELKSNHPKDWLLPLELLEILKKRDEPELMQEILIYIEKIKEKRPEVSQLICNGLELIFEKETV
jgi:phenylalanine-4-hydroxylase